MYKNILVPLDGSELAECVLPHVESIAMGCGVETVTFVRAVEPIHITIDGGEEGYTFGRVDWKRIESESRTMAENYLNQLVNRIKYGGINIKSEVLSDGRTADMIILPDNPLEVDPNDLKDIKVLMTMVGGKTEYYAAGYANLCLENTD